MDPLRGTLGVVLFLPDRNFSFDALDEPCAGLDRAGSMGRPDSHDHTRFTYVDFAQAMNEGDAFDVKLLACDRDQLDHFLNGHRFISFVFEAFGLDISGKASGDADKQRNRTDAIHVAEV